MLSALARALMLTRDERAYLFRIAGETPPPAGGPSREVAPGLRYLIESMPETPAYVLDAKYDILAWNRLATHFIGDLSAVPESERNMVRWLFRQPADDPRWNEEDVVRFARGSVADLRAAYARYPGDPGIEQLVTELLGTSPRFAAMWDAQEVEERRSVVKRFEHPVVGPLEFECHVLHVPDTDQRLVVCSAEPGSPTHAAFHRLAALEPPSLTPTTCLGHARVPDDPWVRTAQPG